MIKLYLLASVSLLALAITGHFQTFIRSEKTIKGDVLDSWQAISSHIQCIAKCKELEKCRAVQGCDVNSTCVLYENYISTDEENRNLFTYFKEPSSCKPGWSLIGDSCYMFVNINMSWYDARHACGSIGAHLTSITSQTEHEAVLDVRLNPALSVWIGGIGIPNGTHHEWTWENGEVWEYENFGGGQPNYDPSGFSCVSIYNTDGSSKKHGTKWNDRNCDRVATRMPCICEMKIA